jgi:Sensors of blue-light using FAD
MDTASEPKPVFRLIYSSHSRIDTDKAPTELGEIFATARRNNRELGVTGALVVADDWFAQTLEGEESVVRKLYERIATDDRHEEVTLLQATNVEDRTFGRWAMARVSEDGGPDIRLMSNAKAGRIVEAGADHHISPEQESVLAFMRGSVTSAVTSDG